MTTHDQPKRISAASTLQDRISRALAPTVLNIEDESHLHEDHLQGPKLLEARGGGHFSVTIVSAEFDGLPLVQRHRLGYAAGGDLMGGRVHALSMETLTPEEWEQAQS